MNWFGRDSARFVKLAYPYSVNLCPNCSSPLLLDFYWEKHKRNIGLGIGKCPVCHKGIKADLLPYRKVENKEETMSFRFSELSPLSSPDYKRLLSLGSPQILITEDEESIATRHPNTYEKSPVVDIPDQLEGEVGNAYRPSQLA
jgi:hypothetical protein